MIAILPFVLATAAHGVAPVKTVVEVRVPLVRTGYDKLLKLRDPGKDIVRRRDFYFDAFDGDRFRLKHLELPIKARLKDAGDAPTFQTSRSRALGRVEAAGLVAALAEIEDEKDSLEQDLGTELLVVSGKFFDNLLRPGAPILDLAEQAHALLAKGDWPGKGVVTRAREDLPPTRLFPAASNTKERSIISLPRPRLAKLSVTLGRTKALDETGAPVALYEVEQDGPAEGAEERARELLEALRRAGLDPDDLGGPSPDAFLFTARRLRE
ncbi:MAG: hypothetical protein HY551_03260 [Elusimicrobia bacterium]|nr:hypothetical protein [Elusimicrobiota bacterium]